MIAQSLSQSRKIALKGVQKTTLVDYPGKLACTVFTGGCNLRCGYCYNADLALRPASLPSIPLEEFFSFLKSRKGFLEGVCITGGEPTLHPGLVEFCKDIKQLGFSVKLDTNGTHPDVLLALFSQGLVDYIAMDVKAPLHLYEHVANVKVPEAALRRSIALIMASGVDYEFRTTLIPDVLTVNDIVQIAKTITGAKRYALQPFLASPTTLDARYADMDPLPLAVMQDMEKAAQPYVQEILLRM